jgi:sulfate adenylyltransferase subunit 1
VQWIEKLHHTSVTHQGRRIFWGRVAAGTVQPGTPVLVFPSGQAAVVAEVLDHARVPGPIAAGHSAGIVLDREVDISRGDWLLAAPLTTPASTEADDDFDTPAPASPYPGTRQLSTTIAWLDDEPLVAGRVYWALHGHRWVKAKVRQVVHQLNIHTLAEEVADRLPANAIGHVELLLQEPLPAVPFQDSRSLGTLILVDTASHKTSGAVLVN